MELKKLLIQVLVAIALYIIISLIIEGDYSQNMILEKARNGVVFGVLYAVYLVIRQKFIKK
ncbi:MAG: hypothetical protein WBM83_15100 [Flavobacteriaceae bacterium]